MAWDTSKVDVGGYEVSWNGSDLGGVHEVAPNLELLMKAIRIGVVGEAVLDEYFDGLREGAAVDVTLAETALAQLRAMVPWDNGSGTIDLTPPLGTRLYQYAQALVLHPKEQGAGATKDVRFFKTVPMHGLPLKRVGVQQNMWIVRFKVFPDHTKLGAGTPAYFEVVGA